MARTRSRWSPAPGGAGVGDGCTGGTCGGCPGGTCGGCGGTTATVPASGLAKTNPTPASPAPTRAIGVTGFGRTPASAAEGTTIEGSGIAGGDGSGTGNGSGNDGDGLADGDALADGDGLAGGVARGEFVETCGAGASLKKRHA